MRRWVSDDGHEVEAIVLDARPLLRVRRRYGTRRYLMTYCADVRELSRLLDLATLTEVIDFPS